MFDRPEFIELFTQDMKITFEHKGVTMPEGRTKMTHSRGVTMEVAFRATSDSLYTGIFKGAKNCIKRVSETFRTSPDTI